MAFECVIEGGAVRSQGYGCTGVSIEPACGRCAHWHSGWDLVAPCGREVYAACSGVVVQIGRDPGYGPSAVFLRRDVDGLVELYGHLLDAVVSPGQPVAAGQLIGHVGTRGNSTGCHVHYSVRPPDNLLTECGAFDPRRYLCSCSAPAPAARSLPSGLAILLSLDPDHGRITSSPAAPGLGVTWEP